MGSPCLISTIVRRVTDNNTSLMLHPLLYAWMIYYVDPLYLIVKHALSADHHSGPAQRRLRNRSTQLHSHP